MLPNLCIFDNFLKDPHAARRRAIDLVRNPQVNHGNYAGQLSSEPLCIEGLSENVSRRLNVALEPAPGTSHDHCRLTLKSDRGKSGVHIDPCDYSGILFLSETTGAKGGTDFFRHRRTGLDFIPKRATDIAAAGYNDVNALIEDTVNRDTALPSKWERVMRVPIRFNRLILFNPWMFHNAGPGFGDDAETGRLVHLMFFRHASGDRK